MNRKKKTERKSASVKSETLKRALPPEESPSLSVVGVPAFLPLHPHNLKGRLPVDKPYPLKQNPQSALPFQKEVCGGSRSTQF